jgi:hypothetical protein
MLAAEVFRSMDKRAENTPLAIFLRQWVNFGVKWSTFR